MWGDHLIAKTPPFFFFTRKAPRRQYDRSDGWAGPSVHAWAAFIRDYCKRNYQNKYVMTCSEGNDFDEESFNWSSLKWTSCFCWIMTAAVGRDVCMIFSLSFLCMTSGSQWFYRLLSPFLSPDFSVLVSQGSIQYSIHPSANYTLAMHRFLTCFTCSIPFIVIFGFVNTTEGKILSLVEVVWYFWTFA